MIPFILSKMHEIPAVTHFYYVLYKMHIYIIAFIFELHCDNRIIMNTNDDVGRTLFVLTLLSESKILYPGWAIFCLLFDKHDKMLNDCCSWSTFTDFNCISDMIHLIQTIPSYFSVATPSFLLICLNELFSFGFENSKNATVLLCIGRQMMKFKLHHHPCQFTSQNEVRVYVSIKKK